MKFRILTITQDLTFSLLKRDNSWGKWDQGTFIHPEVLGPAKILSSGKERTKSPSRFEQALREMGRRQAIYKFTSLSSTVLLHKLVTEGNGRQAHSQYQIHVTVLRL